MKRSTGDLLAAAVFLLAGVFYLFLVSVVCADGTRNAFDVIQGVNVFDVDDSFRQFLAAQPFVTAGLWTWNFILPVNLVFDGLVSWLTGHSLFWMRAAHVMASLGSLFLVYRAGRALGVAALWMLLSCCTLLLMPLYAFLSMSFYGESLLAAAMGVAIFAQVTGRERLFIVTLSLFPLIRPEGIFFLVAMAVAKLLQRRPVSAVLLLVPGFLFFCAVLYQFSSLSAFMGWRSAMDAHVPLMPEGVTVMGYGLMPYYTINPLWWLAGAAGGLLLLLQPLRPLFAGAAIFAGYMAVQCYFKEARGEPRYFFSLLPLMVLGLAAALDTVARFRLGPRGLAAPVVCGVFLLLMVLENIGQMDPVRAGLFGDRRWPLAGERWARTHFALEHPDVTEWRRTTARFIEAYAQYDRSIRKIVIHAYPMFYDLRPDALPEGVVVEFAPKTPVSTFNFFGGYFYAMFPQLPQYAFYRFAPAHETLPNDGGRYALYVGGLYNGIYPPLFANPVYQVYKVSYEARASLPPLPVAGAGEGR